MQQARVGDEADATGKTRPEPVRRGDLQRQIGNFVLKERLGGDALATVYRGAHARLETDVTVYLLRAGDESADDEAALLLDEARRLARVEHAGLLRVLDADVAVGQPYVVFEYVLGRSLRDLILDSPRMTPAQVARLGLQIVEALEAASEYGVLHGNLKPTNVFMLPDGNVKVGGFGLSHRLSSQGNRSDPTVGSLLFAAPEQVAPGTPIGQRADMYRLGATLYFAASGRPPLERGTVQELIRAHLSEFPLALHTVNLSFNRELSQLILRLMAKRPADRPASWPEVSATLRAVLETEIPAGTGASRQLRSLPAPSTTSLASLSTADSASSMPVRDLRELRGPRPPAQPFADPAAPPGLGSLGPGDTKLGAAGASARLSPDRYVPILLGITLIILMIRLAWAFYR